MTYEPGLPYVDDGEDAPSGTFLRALPGGKGSTPDQVAVAALVALALAYLFLVRRGFRSVLPS